jgi:DNA invertase Pin-like site-specific DNA recombinase
LEGNFVAYYRVSTQKQGKSGLGLEARKTAVLDYLNSGGWKLLAEFTEFESGKHECKGYFRGDELLENLVPVGVKRSEKP